MVRKIRYKSISKDLEKMVRPNFNSSIRPSLGLEGSVGEFFFISVDDLIPFHNQARISFDEDEIISLAESIKIHGVRQPLTVLLINGKYEVISGERRLRAAKMIGMSKIPCIVINDEKQADTIALVENVHRKDLHPVELGITYKKLLDREIFSNQQELAEKISVNKSQVSEYIKYANFFPEIQRFIIENKVLSRDKLRGAVKAHENKDIELVKKIIGMNVRQRLNFSILRIITSQGQMKVQEKGIQKLSNLEKEKLKICLTKIIEKI